MFSLLDLDAISGYSAADCVELSLPPARLGVGLKGLSALRTKKKCVEQTLLP